MSWFIDMQAQKKFLYAETFDAGSLDDLVRMEQRFAAQLAEQTQLYEQAGFARGRADALAAIEEQTRVAVSVLGERLGVLSGTLDQLRNQLISEAARAALVAGRSLASALIDQLPVERLELLFSDLIPQVIDTPRLVVRCHQEILDPLMARLQAMAEQMGFEGKLIFIADNSLASTDASIEWAHGGALINIDKQEEELSKTVRSFVTGTLTANHITQESCA